MGKGQISVEMVLKHIITFVIVIVFIFLPTYAFLNAFASSEYFERHYMALDVGLIVDSVLASPNDLVYVYKNPTKEFSVDINQEEVQVYKDADKAHSFYVTNPALDIYYQVVEPLFEVEDGSKKAIPLHLTFVKAGDTVQFYNSQIETLEDALPEDTTADITFEVLVEEGGSISLQSHEDVDDLSSQDIKAYILSVEADPDTIVATDPADFGKKTTSWQKYMQEEGTDLQVAINANFFRSLSDPRFLAGANGNVYEEEGDYLSDRSVGALIIQKDGSIDMVHLNEEMPDIDDIWHVVSGTPMIYDECEIVPIHQWMNDAYRPRTLVALEEDTLFFIIFRSATYDSLIQILDEHTDICDCEDTQCSLLNLDGGGSTTLVWQGEKIFPQEERIVANHLGVT